MSRFALAGRARRVAFSLLVIGAFVLGTTLGPGVVAAANTAVSNVFVTNTSANPVPVTVSNLPVTQPVSGSVSVSNLPTHISVDNTSASPVPVAPQGTTQLLASGQAQVSAGTTNYFISPAVDVSAFQTVRITLNASGTCASDFIIVHDSYYNILLFEQLAASAGCMGSWVLTVPSTAIDVGLDNLNSTAVTVSYSVYGRS